MHSSLVGHVACGAGFLVVGLWQLFNHIRLFALRPRSYVAPVWFPARAVRHLELILIIVGAATLILAELFVGPRKHHPFDDEGSIPSVHLQSLEHVSIALALLLYAAVTIHMDWVGAPITREAVSQLAAATALAQELLLFRLHSSDHAGVEGRFHWLLQLVVAVTLAATLLWFPCPRSLAVSLVRSASVVFQGVWLVVMGVMLWTPELVSKGCFLNLEEGRAVVRCRTEEALARAKSLVNLQFSWYLTGTVLFVVVLYLQLNKVYHEEEPVRKRLNATRVCGAGPGTLTEPRYFPLAKGSHDDGDGDSHASSSIGDDRDDDEDDLEAAKA